MFAASTPALTPPKWVRQVSGLIQQPHTTHTTHTTTAAHPQSGQGWRRTVNPIPFRWCRSPLLKQHDNTAFPLSLQPYATCTKTHIHILYIHPSIHPSLPTQHRHSHTQTNTAIPPDPNTNHVLHPPNNDNNTTQTNPPPLKQQHHHHQQQQPTQQPTMAMARQRPLVTVATRRLPAPGRAFF